MAKKDNQQIFKGRLYVESFGQGNGAHLMVNTLKYTYEPALQSGDYLRIFDKEDKRKVLWKGFITTAYERFLNIHNVPKGIPRNKLKKYYLYGYPAELTKKIAIVNLEKISKESLKSEMEDFKEKDRQYNNKFKKKKK